MRTNGIVGGAHLSVCLPERTAPAPARCGLLDHWHLHVTNRHVTKESSMSLLMPGSEGPEVTELQQKLVAQGYFVGQIDGVFGPKTIAAVAYLQSTHGLDIDAIVGPQVRELLDMDGAANMSVGVTAEWPTIDVWHPGDELVVRLQSLGGAHGHIDVRVSMMFRSPAGTDNWVEQVSVNVGSVSLAHMHLPSSLAGTEGEVYFTGWVFDMQGNQLADEGSGSFRVDLPNRV